MREKLYEIHLGVFVDPDTGIKDYEELVGYTYHSERYDEDITVALGERSDGATKAPDIATRAWQVHDVICKKWRWDSGKKITVLQSSMVLYDIFKEEYQPHRGRLWGFATYGVQLIKRPFRKGGSKDA